MGRSRHVVFFRARLPDTHGIRIWRRRVSGAPDDRRHMVFARKGFSHGVHRGLFNANLVFTTAF
jgi:hypothetical protein